jgi:hypothetical protein
LAEKPTHRIKYAHSRFKADIFISPLVMTRLKSHDFAMRSNARNYVCRRFMEACNIRYKQKWKRQHSYVSWNQITVIPL